MALGAITVAEKAGQVPSNPVFMDRISCAGDGAYPTGGTTGFKATFQAAIKNGRTPMFVAVEDCGGYVPVYDVANDKLKVYYANNDGGSDGPLIEVPNATDLSAVTFKLVVVSQ